MVDLQWLGYRYSSCTRSKKLTPSSGPNQARTAAKISMVTLSFTSSSTSVGVSGTRVHPLLKTALRHSQRSSFKGYFFSGMCSASTNPCRNCFHPTAHFPKNCRCHSNCPTVLFSGSVWSMIIFSKTYDFWVRCENSSLHFPPAWRQRWDADQDLGASIYTTMSPVPHKYSLQVSEVARYFLTWQFGPLHFLRNCPNDTWQCQEKIGP